MPVATMLPSTVHQPVNLTFGEVTPFNCQIYDAWCAFLGSRFHADKPCLRRTVVVCTVVKGGAAAWSASRSQCRMEAPGRVRGMRRRYEPRGWRARRAPGRGDFSVWKPWRVTGGHAAGVQQALSARSGGGLAAAWAGGFQAGAARVRRLRI